MVKINEIEIDAFVDFGNGFKFQIEDIEVNEVKCYGISYLFKVNPKSLDWVKIEEMLKNNETESIKKETSI